MRARLILYNFIILILGLLVLPWVIYQLVFVKKRRQGVAQRFGHSPAMEEETVWCHAVSVGEVRAVTPMLALLEGDERASGRITLSTVTVTGQETAKRECGFVRSILYFPLDLPFAAARAVKRVKPQIFVTAETEIWPNFFHSCFRASVPVVVVNGRISDNSFPRYLKLRWFFRPFLERVSFFLMQSEEDARRILAMGAMPESVRVTGNMKYDRVPERVYLPESVGKWANGRFLFIAGSTHAGEEGIILDALQALKDQEILLALVPRHPERFDEVARLLDKRDLSFTRYSEVLEGRAVHGEVILVDAMGVLDGFYALADIAFVGGSLVQVGGHNLLEPAAHGVPVLAGPYIHNFRDIAKSLVDEGGCLLCRDGQSLLTAIKQLVSDKDKLNFVGSRARFVYESSKGASQHNSSKILAILGERNS